MGKKSGKNSLEFRLQLLSNICVESTSSCDTVDQIGQELNMMQLENMGHVSFRNAIALFGDFARLERALMYYAFDKLTQHVSFIKFAKYNFNLLLQ